MNTSISLLRSKQHTFALAAAEGGKVNGDNTTSSLNIPAQKGVASKI